VPVWRESWAAETNRMLAMGGHDARVDHRGHAERGLAMAPGVKIGVGQERRKAGHLPGYVEARIEAQKEVARQNCDVNGKRRLCLRIDPGLPTTVGNAGEVYAVVHGQ